MAIFSESNTLEGLTPDDIIPESTVPDFEYSAPTIQRELPSYLSDFSNLSYTGTLRTDDDRTIPSIAFMTVYRDDEAEGEIAHYYNGYGIAVRPSTDISQLNVFVVDNALAVQDVVLENVLHTGWGDYAYLAAAHVDIEYNTTYNWRIDIGSGNALSFYIWKTTDAFPGAPQLTYGAYIPVSNGRSYGVSVSNTGGYHWWWDNLSLSHTTSNHAIEVYEFDVTDFSSDFVVKASAWGEGYNGISSGNGIIMYAWDYIDEEWVELDRHTFGQDASNLTLTSAELSINTYSNQNLAHPKATVVLVSLYPSSFSLSVDSLVKVDYIYLECWDSAFAHVGGMGDVYVKINETPSLNSVDIENVGTKEWLTENNPAIDGDLQLPLLWIRNVELLDVTGQPSGISLTPNTNYSFVVDSEEKRFSTKEENYLIFAGSALGGDVRLNYYTYPSMDSMQAYCDTDISRNVTDDYLVKSYLPVELFMDITYKGSLNPITARSILAQWINSGTRKTLTKADIAIKLQAEDEVNYAVVNSLSYISHDKDGGTTTSSSSPLTIGSREHFILLPDATHVSITTT